MHGDFLNCRWNDCMVFVWTGRTETLANMRSSSTLPVPQPNSQPPTPTRLLGSGPAFDFSTEERGDLIQFYNKVSGCTFKTFSLVCVCVCVCVCLCVYVPERVCVCVCVPECVCMQAYMSVYVNVWMDTLCAYVCLHVCECVCVCVCVCEAFLFL